MAWRLSKRSEWQLAEIATPPTLTPPLAGREWEGALILGLVTERIHRPPREGYVIHEQPVDAGGEEHADFGFQVTIGIRVRATPQLRR